MNEKPSGEGKLLSDAKQSKKERTTAYQVELGERAHRVLNTILRKYRVTPEAVLRDMAEGVLHDAKEDQDVLLATAEGALTLLRTGRTDHVWNEPTEPFDDSLQPEDTAGPVHRVTLEFTPAAYGLLLASSVLDGFGTVEEAILRYLAGTSYAMTESLSEEDTRQLFGCRERQKESEVQP